MKIFIEPQFTEYYRRFPLALIDIGASGGTERNWKTAGKYLQILGFEPDERAFLALKKSADSSIRYLNTCLYNQKASLKYYLTDKQQASSIFRPNAEFINKFPEVERFNVIKEVNIETDNLDNQLKKHNIVEADFIKIDTQGSELFILQGGEQTIKENIFGIEIEVEFAELYQGQPLFADIDNFIRKQGFHLFDIQRQYWKRAVGKACGNKKGQLVFGNALYLRKSGDFLKILDKIPDDVKKKGKALKAISICLLYGYVDYALEILQTIRKIFDEVEIKVINQRIGQTKKMMPNFKGSSKIADIFCFLWEIFRPTHGGWASQDKRLGNL